MVYDESMEKLTRDEACDNLHTFFGRNVPTAWLLYPVEYYVSRFVDIKRGSCVVCTWRVSFGIEVTLSIELEKLTLSWGGMMRPIPNAVASLALYRQVVDFAVLLDQYREEQFACVKKK